MFRRAAIMVLVSCLLAACDRPMQTPAASTSPDIARLAQSYKDLERMTEGPRYISSRLAVWCRAYTPGEVAREQKKYGPHAQTAVHIYMNKLASDALRSEARPFPVGAIIVQDRNVSLSAAAVGGVGGMIKRPVGFDAAHGDWEYFSFTDPASIRSGRLNTCITCHTQAAHRDYVFGDWAKPPKLPEFE